MNARINDREQRIYLSESFGHDGVNELFTFGIAIQFTFKGDDTPLQTSGPQCDDERTFFSEMNRCGETETQCFIELHWYVPFIDEDILAKDLKFLHREDGGFQRRYVAIGLLQSVRAG